MNQKPNHSAGIALMAAVLACAGLAGRSLPAAVTIADFEKGLDGWGETKDIKLSLVDGTAPGSKAMKVDYLDYHDNWTMARKIFREDCGDVDALSLWIKSVGAIASRNKQRVAVAVYHVDPTRKEQGGNPAKVRLAIASLGSRSKISLYRIDHRHHDLYSFWNEQLGRPESDRGDRALSDELHRKLLAKEKLTPSPIPASWAVDNGTLRCTLEVPTNGVAFLSVEE